LVVGRWSLVWWSLVLVVGPLVVVVVVSRQSLVRWSLVRELS